MPRLRQGDHVIIRVPRVVTRVGYPKGVNDFLHELQADPEVIGMARALVQLATGRQYADERFIKIMRELAYLRARAHCFGGRERTIHFEDRPDLQGAEARIDGLRTAHTGIYMPPVDHFDDWEPGYLKDEQRHRIAMVMILNGSMDQVELPIAHLERAA